MTSPTLHESITAGNIEGVVANRNSASSASKCGVPSDDDGERGERGNSEGDTKCLSPNSSHLVDRYARATVDRLNQEYI